MEHKLSSTPLVLIAIFASCTSGLSQAAENRPPAGQQCAEGAYVTGFDQDGNIICSVPGGAQAPVAPDTEAQVNTGADAACPPDCPAETSVAGAAAVPVAASEPAAEVQSTGSAAPPVISGVKPRSVVFGARETRIVITGAGFSDASVVKFHGADYTPEVNDSGTELRVTLPTRKLPMGRYAVTVSNGPGLEATRKKALEVF